jgi:lipopolysaccharide/colanic/teichoic acid biosynthesis glycosyltransferase
VNRAADVAGAAFGLALASPLLAAAALAIKLEDGGPVLYRQRRVGLGGREFELLKLRTMIVGAETKGAGLAVNEGDARITRAGRVLRRLSLDELPQLVNVLRGEMSLVGPRPLPLRDFEKLEAWHRKRYFVLPGITGLWQISGRSNLTFDDLVRLDFFYIENWSIWLDITILAKTPLAVLSGRGAY